MSLTRSFLRGMNLTDEQVSAIIDEHVAVVDALKAERDELKKDAKKLSEVQKELEAAKGGEDWKKKYEDEHKAFEAYRTSVKDAEKLGKVKDAYKKLLLESGVGERHIDAILKVTDFSGMKLGEDGGLQDADKLTETIKTDWSGFIGKPATKGANVQTPPAQSGRKVWSREEIMKIQDTTERQKAWGEFLSQQRGE